jgi:PHD/YefM family antitoxin component YafN of YafNO toxin-antitoxin module
MTAWQATRARGALSAIIDAAVDGTPQFIRRRDGKEVVVVSRDHFEISKPNLRDYLLRSGYAPDHDAFDDTMREVRTSLGAAFNPRALDFDA